MGFFLVIHQPSFRFACFPLFLSVALIAQCLCGEDSPVEGGWQ